MTEVQIAILGCGTVGKGLLEVIEKHNAKKNSSVKIKVKKILVRNSKRAGELAVELNLDREVFTDDVNAIVSDPEIKIVVEVMGGTDQAQNHILKAIEAKKQIVTANKDLLATNGEEIFEAAKKQGVIVLYEAAVAGGIPVIATLKQSLQGNRILKLLGIINGTTNYILDVMKKEGKGFDEVLKTAQELGFAESDPTNDVGGHDAAFKTAILASIITDRRIDIDKVYREGIDKISTQDITAATKRGYVIKLLGIINHLHKAVDLRVHPVMLSVDNPLAGVGLENNAVLIQGDAVQELTLIGKGAGALPTASSVFGDVLMLAGQGQTQLSQFVCKHSGYANQVDIKEVCNSFYIRVAMHDKIGALKDLTALTAKYGANVKFFDQYDVCDEEAHADFIIDPLQEAKMLAMTEEMSQLDSVKSVESIIRVIL